MQIDCPRLLLRMASRLTPARLRSSFYSSQDARVWYQEREWRRQGWPEWRVQAGATFSALRAFIDVIWTYTEREAAQDSFWRAVRHPATVFVVIGALFLFIAVMSGGFLHTQRQLNGFPFAQFDRVVTLVISERPPILSLRYGPSGHQIDLWRNQSKSFTAIAAFNIANSHLGSGKTFRHLLVTSNWFHVLQMSVPVSMAEPDHVLLTRPFISKFLHGEDPPIGSKIVIDGRDMRVAGVLPRTFWFINDDLGAISVFPPDWQGSEYIGLARLRDGVAPESAEKELNSFRPLKPAYVLGLLDRLRAPIRNEGLYTLAALLFFEVLTVVRIIRKQQELRYALFFFGKLLGGLLVILLFTFEFLATNNIAATGVASLSREIPAFLAWLFSSAIYILWVYRDQPGRCRRCLRRLELPTSVGALGRVLFDHEGTELICPRGHGTLYIEPSTETWRQSGRWTEFDESWQELFEEKK